MAIIDKKGLIHGKVGTVTYRSFRGSNVVQSLPKKGKQTQATKQSACEFGLSSNTARIMREALEPLHGNRNDGGLVNRFTSSVYRAIRSCSSKERGERDIHDGDLSYLEGLEMNINSRFSEVFRARLQASRNEKGQVVVSVPEIDGQRDIRARVHQPDGCQFVLRFVLLGLNYREQFYKYLGVKEIQFYKSTRLEAQELVFEQEVPKGCLLVLGVSLRLEYTDPINWKWESLNSMQFNPGIILAAFEAGEEAEEGYGHQFTTREHDESESSGTLWLSGGLIQYEGPKLLAKMKGMMLKQQKKEEKERTEREKRRLARRAALEDPDDLTGKIVKF